LPYKILSLARLPVPPPEQVGHHLKMMRNGRTRKSSCLVVQLEFENYFRLRGACGLVGTGIGTASQTLRHPGKFHSLGKPLHWRGLTAWMRQLLPCRKMQESSVRSIRLSPLRCFRSLVKSRMKELASSLRKRAMGSISSSSILTSPGQRQQFAQRWH